MYRAWIYRLPNSGTVEGDWRWRWNLTARPVSNVQCAHDAPFKVTVTPIRWRTDEEITVEQHDDHICGVFKSDQCLRRMKAEIILERCLDIKKSFFFFFSKLLVMMSRNESSGRIRSLASSCTSPTCPQRVHRWPVDRPVITSARHGRHDEVPSEGHGSDASEEGICLGDHGPGWSLGPCCFAFFSFLQNKKPSKKLLKVRLFAEVCGWIVELLEQGSNRFLSLKSFKDNHFFLKFACRNHVLVFL